MLAVIVMLRRIIVVIYLTAGRGADCSGCPALLTGGLIGGLASGFLAQELGRKHCLLLNNIVALVALFLMTTSKDANSWIMLLWGRFLNGLNAGINFPVLLIYLIEIAPIGIRGSVGIFQVLGMNIGVLMALTFRLQHVLGLSLIHI